MVNFFSIVQYDLDKAIYEQHCGEEPKGRHLRQ